MIKLHPAIIHFPIALLLLCALFGLASLLGKRDMWKGLAFKALLGGVITAPLAVVTGFMEMQAMHHESTDPMLTYHKYNGIAITLFFSALLLWYWLRKGITGNREYLIWVMCLLAGSGLVLLQGYLGGEMVYAKGMGVKPVEDSGMGHGGASHGSGNEQHSESSAQNHSQHSDDTMKKENDKDMPKQDHEQMDQSKMDHHMKKGSEKKMKEMPGMPMKSVPDTFKFEDNNPNKRKKATH